MITMEKIEIETHVRDMTNMLISVNLVLSGLNGTENSDEFLASGETPFG